jgi:hypothetical protein
MSEPASSWFFRRGERQIGPLTWGELSALSAANQVMASDDVSEDGAQWMSAAQVPGLPFGAASADSALNYNAPRERPTIISGYACETLGQTSPYVRVMSVILFIVAGLMAVIALLMGAGGALAGQVAPIAGAVVYLGVTVLYVIPAVFLTRYASNASAFARHREGRLLEKAIEAQKSFWKFAAIATLIGVILYIVLIVVLIGLGVFSRI